MKRLVLALVLSVCVLWMGATHAVTASADAGIGTQIAITDIFVSGTNQPVDPLSVTIFSEADVYISFLQREGNVIADGATNDDGPVSWPPDPDRPISTDAGVLAVAMSPSGSVINEVSFNSYKEVTNLSANPIDVVIQVSYTVIGYGIIDDPAVAFAFSTASLGIDITGGSAPPGNVFSTLQTASGAVGFPGSDRYDVRDSVSMTVTLGAASTGTAVARASAAGYVRAEASVVPVPAAIWLFGSALSVCGWMRRNSA